MRQDMKSLFKNLIILFILLPTLAFATDAYHCSGGLTGGGVGALDAIANPSDNDIAYVHWNGDATYGNTTLVYTFDIGASAGESVPWIIAPDVGSGEWELWVNRDFNVLNKALADETNTNITETEILLNKWITNQGSTSEADLVLPDLEYYISVVFIINEASIIEINPPAGELFDLDGVLLDANDCVDSPVDIGAKLVATRMLLADGSTWRWSLDTVRGIWVDTGATD